MNLFKKLFGNTKNHETKNTKPNSIIEEKLKHRVFPRIKNKDSQNFEYVYHKPIGGDLVLTFVQDIDDRLTYIQKSEVEQLQHLIDGWKHNIQEVEYHLFTSEEWQGEVYFNEPNDYSNEKIFDPNFINDACEKLNTDKVVISISRRHRMQITSYDNDFNRFQSFFYNHFDVYRDNDLQDEHITEYVLIGAKNQGITDIVHLGFRMNLYEKEGQYVLSYSVFDDGEVPIEDKLDFIEIIEKRKEKFVY